MKADTAAQPATLSKSMAATDQAAQTSSTAATTTSVGFATPMSIGSLWADTTVRKSVASTADQTLVHLWAAFPNYVDNTTLYTELNVQAGDSVQTVTKRWLSYLLPDLDQAAAAHPESAKSIASVRAAAASGDFKIIGARYKGTAACMAQLSHTPPTPLFSVASTPAGGSEATPVFPPDTASQAAVKEACGS